MRDIRHGLGGRQLLMISKASLPLIALEGADNLCSRHHELFRVNFGTNGLLDWVHGTNEKKGEEPKKMHYD